MHKLDLRFTGSGSEYFRIWIVNLLLIFVTLGLYYPWAKARRLRYFHQNTVIGNAETGQHAMDFHGDPKAMLRGQLLAFGLFALYSVAVNFSAIGALLALVAMAALAPALFNTALRFRLANTSWRGMRFHFTGSLRDAYRSMLPAYVPALLVILPVLAAPMAAGVGKQPPAAAASPALTSVIGIAVMIAMVIGVLLLPWCLQQVKRYQHTHYAYGQLTTGFDAGPGAFYRLALKVIAISFGGMAAVFMIMLAASTSKPASGGMTAIGLAVSFLPLVILVTVKPYLLSRLQNLIWSHTRNDTIVFTSQLRMLPLLGLTLKNWLLIVLSLGLYWPFAAVALARMRLHAVSLKTRDHPDEIVNQANPDVKGAMGDAATDLFGFDIGL